MLQDLQIYFGVALAGLVSFLSPCVLPLVPPYLGYLGGATIDEMTAEEGVEDHVWRRVVVASIFFVMGFTTVFVGLGAGASAFGQLIETYKPQLSLIAGGIIILFGLHFIGVFKISALYMEKRYHHQPAGASYLGSYVIGLAFAFGWTPCVGPILAAVLALAAQEASLTTGVKMLFVYSLGLGVPFVLAAVAIGPFLKFMRRFRRHLGQVERVMGFFLLLAGTLMIAGPVHEWLQGTHPAIVKNGKWLGLLAAWGGAALLLGLGAWIAGHLRARLTEVHQTAISLAGLALFTGGVCVWGGSMNGFGVWLIDTFPGLSRIEETFVPKSLQTEIRKQGAGQ